MSLSQMPIKDSSGVTPHSEEVLCCTWEEVGFLVIRTGVHTPAFPFAGSVFVLCGLVFVFSSIPFSQDCYEIQASSQEKLI